MFESDLCFGVLEESIPEDVGCKERDVREYHNRRLALKRKLACRLKDIKTRIVDEMNVREGSERKCKIARRETLRAKREWDSRQTERADEVKRSWRTDRLVLKHTLVSVSLVFEYP